MELTQNEKQFLIGCIITSAYEGFYKNEVSMTNEEIKHLLIRLGASEEDLDEYDRA